MTPTTTMDEDEDGSGRAKNARAESVPSIQCLLRAVSDSQHRRPQEAEMQLQRLGRAAPMHQAQLPSAALLADPSS
ncbi:hypothetical protein ACSS6W_005673 [Trichoderma asperelloides]